jgi:hypothetical protein
MATASITALVIMVVFARVVGQRRTIEKLVILALGIV